MNHLLCFISQGDEYVAMEPRANMQKTIPWECYKEPVFFAAEKSYFESSWQLLCHGSELLSGAVLQRQIWGGQVRASEKTGRLVVEFKADDEGQFEILNSERITRIHGLIFFCSRPSTSSLVQAFLPFAKELQSAGIENMTPVDNFASEALVDANWKLIVEISLDETHVEMVHPEYSRLLSGAVGYVSHRGIRRWHQVLGFHLRTHWWGHIYLVTLFLLTGRFCKHQWSYYWIFPGLELEIYPEQIIYYQIVPLSENRTIKRSLRLSKKTRNPFVGILRFANERIQKKIDQQDIDCVLQRQSIMTSRNMGPQEFSSGDSLVRKFHEIIAKAIEKANG